MASIIRATDQNTIRRRGTGLRRSDPTKACPGYTLFAPLTGAGEVYLVDLAGNVVHAWKLPYPPGLHGYLLPNGHLFYGAKTPDVPAPVRPPGWELFKGGAMFEVDWAGNTVWEFYHDDHHHDAVRLRNGNTAFLSAERVPADLARRIHGGVPGTEVEGAVFATVVHEITPAGAIVWTWRSYEHLDPEADPIPPQIRREFWAMSNTVGELANGSLILSFVNLSLVVIVDRTTGAITWRVGAPVVSGQHDPHELPNGNILIFDNGARTVSSGFPRSRVIELDRATQEIVWQYMDDPPHNFFSWYISGAQRLPNGNTLITEGAFGRLFEVTPAGQTVWEYVNPHCGPFPPPWRAAATPRGSSAFTGEHNAVFRAFRYTVDDLPALR